jgi:hypothetical protein
MSGGGPAGAVRLDGHSFRPTLVPFPASGRSRRRCTDGRHRGQVFGDIEDTMVG